MSGHEHSLGRAEHTDRHARSTDCAGLGYRGDELRLVADNPLVNALPLGDTPPEGYTLLKNIVFQSDEGPGAVYARLYDVSPADAAGGD
jgi:hypothetical protein